MTAEEIFKMLVKLTKKYSLVSGSVLIKESDGFFYMQNPESVDYWPTCGYVEDELLADAFAEFDCMVEKEGYYEFKALVYTNEPQLGEEGLIEIQRHVEIEHIEFYFKISEEGMNALYNNETLYLEGQDPF